LVTREGVHVKDLRIFADRDLKDLVLVGKNYNTLILYL